MNIHKKITRFWELYDMLVIFSIGHLLGWFGISWEENRWKEFCTFARFWVIGLSATLVSYVSNIIVLVSIHGLGRQYDFVIANSAAFMVSVCWTFYWNNRYVFRKSEMKNGEQRNTLKAFVRTMLCYAFTGLVLNNVLGYVWIYIAGISKYTAPVLNLLIGFPVNFIMNRLWAFKS